MFSSRPLSRISHTGMIVLALMAALPEMVCCCEVSWGPGGLLGSQALCQEKSITAACCCCESGSGEQDAPHHKGDVQGCRCTFKIVSPAPISLERGDELTHTPFCDLSWSLESIVADETSSAITRLAAATSPALTSAHRCALTQSWLI